MSLGLPAAVRDSASRAAFGGHDWAAVALLAIAALVVIVLAILLFARRSRRAAEQHMGETFTAAQFTALCDNMSWYGRSTAGPAPPGVRPDAVSGPEFTLPHRPPPPSPGRHSAPPAT